MAISKISGFPEYTPAMQIAFNKVLSIIKEKFELFGFSPLDTPAVEKISTLLAKGNDNEIYGIYRLADANDKKDLALRFDLTVPLARYVVQHSDELVFPYKRYHIAPVWRGERAQAGRYRQFYQCDIDIVDNNDLSFNCDAEIVALVSEILKALKVDFEFKINNKKILDGMVSYITDGSISSIDILRVIDKKEKVEEDKFCSMLLDLGLNSKQVNMILDFLSLSGTNLEILNKLNSLNYNETFNNGVRELKALFDNLALFGVDYNNVKIDMSLARGLTYYTGSIFEAKLRNLNFLGSICGGGRYDNLTTYFSKNRYPGVGATIGISRLIPVLIENNLLEAKEMSPAKVLVTVQNADMIKEYISISQMLRNAGIKTELFLQNKKLAQQITYASKKGFKYIVIANQEELFNNNVNIKNLETGEQNMVSKDELIKKLKDVAC